MSACVNFFDKNDDSLTSQSAGEGEYIFIVIFQPESVHTQKVFHLKELTGTFITEN